MIVMFAMSTHDEDSFEYFAEDLAERHIVKIW